MWRHFYAEPKPAVNIRFGRWDCQLDRLDYDYHQLATRFIQFAKEIGEDPYNRYFAVEPLIDFAISTAITNKSTDYIYRHYIYHLLSQYEDIDTDQEELRILFDEFLLVPEGEQVYYDRRYIKSTDSEQNFVKE
uniref:Uncharacterized protein n=1 Tax=Marseillevirus LCMAC202 TaxID=2506606 RepID=A0A481YZ25_9VIRU|nr:MAG: hypothetical protein LCMAC202_06120 [Marseillevirus LCMAC202]